MQARDPLGGNAFRGKCRGVGEFPDLPFFLKEYIVVIPLGFTGNLSLLDIFLHFPGVLGKWKVTSTKLPRSQNPNPRDLSWWPKKMYPKWDGKAGNIRRPCS